MQYALEQFQYRKQVVDIKGKMLANFLEGSLWSTKVEIPIVSLCIV